MTHKEFIKGCAKYDNEFRILFKKDLNPVWETAKAKEVTEEGCTLHFINVPRDDSLNALLDEVLGEVLEYTWDELTPEKIDMLEIWV